MRLTSARMLERIGQLDQEWLDDPAVADLASYMAARHGISAALAAERLRVARALRGLPKILEAHAEGRLSWDQVRWVTRFATPDTEEEWAERAAGMRPNALRLEWLRQSRLQRREANRDHAARSLWMAWDGDRRFLDVHASLPAEQGAAVESALNSAAQKITVEDDVDDRRGARLADAFVALLTSSSGSSPVATLVVHADADVLAGTSDGDRRLAETSSGSQVSFDAVRRLACEAKVLWSLDRERQAVGIVSRGRKVTEHQMEMLIFRDRGCTFPGCGSRWFLHAHHIRHWADGGKTRLDNLTLLCGVHHRKVHEGGWTIRGRPPDGIEFLSRSGQVLNSAGPQLARAG